MNRGKTFLLAVLLLTFLPVALAQGTYTQIDYPGATSTQCFGINTAGDLVGGYRDAFTTQHGFLLSGGIYTTIDSRFRNTSLTGINDVGQIVGQSGVGFVYDLQTQKFANIKYPGTRLNTAPTSINNAGTVGGFFYHKNDTGFALRNSTYFHVALPGTVATYVNGISASGKLVGFALSGSYFNFSYAQGKYQKITIPDAPNALVYGISPAGDAIVGEYSAPSGVIAGFVYQNKVLQTVAFPGSKETIAVGINNAGEVVGYFFDSRNALHGFTWIPPADAVKR